MKKILSLLLILLLVPPPSPVSGALSENLIQNGGFEQLNGAKPNGWRSTDSNWLTTTVVEQSNVRDGNYAVKITTPAGGDSYIYQRVWVLAETEYTMGFWVYTENIASNSALRVKLEFYDAVSETEKTGLGKDKTVHFDVTGSTNRWVYLTQSFTTPEGCNMISFISRLAPVSSVYIDDISLYQTSQPRHITLSTDGVFYYSDLESGTAKVRLNPYYSSSLPGAKVNFTIKDGTTIVTQRPDVEFSGGYAAYTFPLSCLKVTKKQYTMTAELKDSGGTILATEVLSIYKYDRPSAIGKDGIYRINGEVFNPVFAYHVPQNMYADCVKAGINVVQLSYWYADYEAGGAARILNALDVCEQYGLKALVTLYRNMIPAGDDRNLSNTKAVVAAAKGHSAVFAWAVMDEPFHQVLDAEKVLEVSYKTIRDIDDVHPVYIVDAATECFGAQAKYVDIMGIDPYPRGIHSSAAYVAEQIELAQIAVNYNKPVYALLQAFLYGDTDGDKVDDYFPTFSEVRSMWYQALMAGAKAVGYYAIGDCYGDIPIMQTQLWEGVCGFAEEEIGFSYNFFIHRSKTLTREYKDDDVWVKTWETEEGTYAAVLSRKTADKPVSVFLGEGKIKETPSGTAEGCTGFSNGILTMQLKGSAANIYKIESDGIMLSKNGVIQNTLTDGPLSIDCNIKDTNGTKVRVMAALYENTGVAMKLKKIYQIAEGTFTNGIFLVQSELDIQSAGMHTFKVFAFNGSFNPLATAAVLKVK